MSTPEGLHAVQYAREIIEETLGWPSKGNIEIVADCLTSIARAKKLTLVKAHGYLKRAVLLAKDQGIEVNHFFFSNGEYMNVRPQKETFREPYNGCGKCDSGWLPVSQHSVKRCECVK